MFDRILIKLLDNICIVEYSKEDSNFYGKIYQVCNLRNPRLFCHYFEIKEQIPDRHALRRYLNCDNVDIDEFILNNIGKCEGNFLNCYLDMFSYKLKEETLQKIELHSRI